MSTKTSVSAADVQAMLRAGVDRPQIVRQLMETGVWTRAGAADIVRLMSRAADALPKSTSVGGRRQAT